MDSKEDKDNNGSLAFMAGWGIFSFLCTLFVFYVMIKALFYVIHVIF